MIRRQSMNGVLIIDKPAGMTSHDVVQRVRRVSQERSVGHLGTLDPMATGVLPLLLGRFTRLAQFFGDAEKEYEGTIRFGLATDTHDAEGEPLGAEKPLTFTADELQAAVQELTGKIQQTPPAFSAKKVAGVPAYKLARQGSGPELKPVEVNVVQFAVWEAGPGAPDAAGASTLHNTYYRTWDTGESQEGYSPCIYRFHAVVSSGTYVRSLAHDLGQRLGCGAHLVSLRRLRSGEFSLEQAVSLDALHPGLAPTVPIRDVLRNLPAVQITDAQRARIAHGNATNLPDLSAAPRVKVFYAGELIAIAERIAGTLFQPRVVLT